MATNCRAIPYRSSAGTLRTAHVVLFGMLLGARELVQDDSQIAEPVREAGGSRCKLKARFCAHFR
jgi:hypothetical protein